MTITGSFGVGKWGEGEYGVGEGGEEGDCTGGSVTEMRGGFLKRFVNDDEGSHDS